MKYVVLFEEKAFIRSRLQRLSSLAHIEIHEVDSYAQMVSFVEDGKVNIDMIMMDINFDDVELVEQFRVFREKFSQIPLVVFTSTSSRKAFVMAMKWGAQDFILKSMADATLISRLQKNLAIVEEDNEGVSVSTNNSLHMNVERYLSGEIQKAQKANYAFTMCFNTVFKVDGEDNRHPFNLNQTMLDKIQNEYWDTDVLMPLGLNYYVSFFPFCDTAGRDVLEEKIQNNFQKLKDKTPEFEGTILVNEFVTFPDDGINKEDMLNKLIEACDKDK